MRNFIAILFALLFVTVTRADTTNLILLANVNGTNNGGVFYVSNIYIPPQAFLFYAGAITNASSGSYLTNGITNSITVNIQVSVDASNTNWLTVATWHPSGTNGVSEQVTPTLSQVVMPMRAQVITTNALPFSSTKL